MPIRAEIEGIGPVEFEDGTPQSVIDATIKNLVRKPPTNTRVAINAANRAIAGLPDALLNTPANLINLGKAGFGTAATALGRPDLAPNISDPPNLVSRGFEAMGFIDPAQDPQTAQQRMIANVAGGVTAGIMAPANAPKQMLTNAAMGGASGLTSAATKEATGSDAAAMAAGMLTPKVLQTMGDKGRAAVQDIARQQSANAVRDQTYQDARSLGYITEPSTLRPGGLNDFLSGIAGKAATKQEATLRNQAVTTRAAADELRMDTPITPQALNEFRERVAWPYREASAISKTGAATVERLKDARYNRRLQENFFSRSGDPEAKQKADGFAKMEQALEARLQKIVSQAGKPDLVRDLKESRREIAKSYSIEDALNLGDANVAAKDLGRQLSKGDPLSGNLETIAKFSIGPGRRVTGEESATPASNVSQVKPLAATAMAMGGSGVGGLAGTALGAIPYISGPVRDLILSPGYQSAMAGPKYSAGLLNKGAAQIGPYSEQDELIRSLLQGLP